MSFLDLIIDFFVVAPQGPAFFVSLSIFGPLFSISSQSLLQVYIEFHLCQTLRFILSLLLPYSLKCPYLYNILMLSKPYVAIM